MNKGLKWVSILTTIGMFLVLIMGSLVTKTGSADGCGNSWPLCHGQFAPLDNIESLIEWSHRAVSGAVGILVTWQSIWAWRKHGDIKGVKFFALGGFLCTFAQALLGAAAVIWPQSDAVLALHFGLSLTAFASVLMLTILVFDSARMQQQSLIPITTRMKRAIWLLTIYSYVVVYLGAYVRHTNSGLGCQTWPTCNGQWIPELTGAVGIQMIHRLAACLFLLFVIGLTLTTRKHYRMRKDLYYGSIWVLILTGMQIFSGGYVVLSRIQLFPALLHNAIISALFGVLCFLCFQTLDQSKPVKSSRKGTFHG